MDISPGPFPFAEPEQAQIHVRGYVVASQAFSFLESKLACSSCPLFHAPVLLQRKCTIFVLVESD